MQRFKPIFLDEGHKQGGSFQHLFNFRRMWKLAVSLTAFVSLLPLITLAVVDYRVTQDAIESEILFRTARLVSNTRRSLAYFIAARKSALDFINQDNTYEALNDAGRLHQLLDHLKKGFGDFVDLSVIDETGRQRTYAGPYHLEGKTYQDQEWFIRVKKSGRYISDVFLGFRKVPHMVIAFRHELKGGGFYVLRATIDTEAFAERLDHIDLSGEGDIYIVNRQGVLQTSSRLHGKVFEKIDFPVPPYSEKTKVNVFRSSKCSTCLLGYAYVEDTPFILMIQKNKKELMKPWFTTRLKLLGFLGASITVILVVILGMATYLVNMIYLTDKKRLAILHKVEYSNKMASIGRLAAGVAHEINNPLAIINEKAGLIKDLFTFRPTYAADEKLVGLINSILASVERCARITQRLLGFSRRTDIRVEDIRLNDLVAEVLGFLGKEAEYRSIGVTLNIPEDLKPVQSDKGKLQEIFLNLFNNSLAAMKDGGHLEITATNQGDESVRVTVADDGCGIAPNDVHRIFEPFFSTKTNCGGTGLGLSITYGLVKKIGGEIHVQSELGKGTVFTILIPYEWKLEITENAGLEDSVSN